MQDHCPKQQIILHNTTNTESLVVDGVQIQINKRVKHPDQLSPDSFQCVLVSSVLQSWTRRTCLDIGGCVSHSPALRWQYCNDFRFERGTQKEPGTGQNLLWPRGTAGKREEVVRLPYQVDRENLHPELSVLPRTHSLHSVNSASFRCNQSPLCLSSYVCGWHWTVQIGFSFRSFHSFTDHWSLHFGREGLGSSK